jgi:dinuclear metal center YbgI/SA1388 family protein
VKLNELFALLEREVAPVKLSDEFCKACSAYDNSGIILDCGQDVNGILFTLELSVNVVTEAKRLGYNTIVTHHPAIYGGIKRLNPCSNPQDDALCECIKCGISIISMHLNFDAAKEGIDYYLMRGIGGDNAKMQVELSLGGYGRVYKIKQTTLEGLVTYIKKQFKSERVIYFGDKNKNIATVASFCGAGCDEGAITFAVENGADVLVSSDLKHHNIAELVARGMGVIAITHYAAESYGMNKIYQKVSDKLGVHSAYFYDEQLL